MQFGNMVKLFENSFRKHESLKLELKVLAQSIVFYFDDLTQKSLQEYIEYVYSNDYKSYEVLPEMDKIHELIKSGEHPMIAISKVKNEQLLKLPKDSLITTKTSKTIKNMVQDITLSN